jgi:4'-phosphopantetheinyl transferase
MEWMDPILADMPIPTEELHVWRIDLRAWAARREELAALLDADERSRAARFKFDRLTLGFTIARGRQRSILGRYLGLDPAALRFRLGAHGKPELDLVEGAPPLRFNLSHSGDFVLLAVTRERRVGVDIEAMTRAIGEMEDIAERFFAPAEVAAWRALPSTDRRHAFFLCWTRKEAFLKALGDGLSRPLDSFEVELRPGASARLLSLDGDPAAAAAWRLVDLDPGSDYAGAVCYEGDGRFMNRPYGDIDSW